MNAHSRVYAKIDTGAVRHNLEEIQKILKPGTKVAAVIKADGYGHGALEIADAIQDAGCLYGFAVATAEEALFLRHHGINKPILILGYVFEEHYQELIAQGIALTVFTLEMARQLSAVAVKLKKDIAIHIKIDTGMGRIGMQVGEESAKIIAQISSLPHIVVEGIFTHFARADETDKSAACQQLTQFIQMMHLLEGEGIQIPYRHCANSAAILDLPQANMDLVRAGIILYGLWPSDEVQKNRVRLRPALGLISHVAYVKQLEAGRSISYGGTYTAETAKTVATIPVGYGDGYPRSLSNKGYVLIHGQKAPILGRVCMDQFMVDVTDIPDVKTGVKATLVGEDGGRRITLEELGELSGRFNYEFACGISRRVPRIYYENNIPISDGPSSG